MKKDMKLRPCPFCASKDVGVQVGNQPGLWMRVSCYHCGASSNWAQADNYEDTGHAAQLWNKRVHENIKLEEVLHRQAHRPPLVS